MVDDAEPSATRPPRVYVSRRLPLDGLAPLLDGTLTVDVRQADDPAPRVELLRQVRGASALITLLTDRIDEALLDEAGPALRVVANYAVGFDNVDVDACTRRGVAVATTPDVLTEATADHAFALLLAVARRLREGHALVASGAWTGWQPMQLLGREVGGRTLGILGMGRIGRAVARRGHGFGMRVLYHNRRRDPGAEAELGASWVPLDDLFRRSDALSVHLPLTSASHHLIDARRLALMPRHAILVNTGRGAVVDEAALVDALRHGALFGAGLDVFEREPAITDGLLALDNVVLAPHTGSATEGARSAMARLCAEAIVGVLAGRIPANVLNPEALAGGRA